MSQFREEQQILTDLGLTLLQARVYIALTVSEPLRASEIAKKSEVARPDVYRTVSKLQEIGLVEKIIAAPVKYRAIPMEKGLTLLLKRKTRQYKKVRARTQVLLEKARTKRQSNADQMNGDQFVWVPEGKTIIERIRNSLENASQSVDLILSWKRFSRGIASTFAESIEKAWKNGAKIRFIVEKPSESKTAGDLIKFCEEKHSCQMRFTSKYPRTVLGIYDEKEVFIIVDPKTDLPGSPALWSNSSSLISLARDYFEVLWFTAMGITHLKFNGEPVA
ncbi:MAG: hypothetical protein NWE99_04840 [Candidatus Bathyarchaeota archaeon]|nr:hypothetical protein [Candidatus Bathyarchaeota archaeon]